MKRTLIAILILAASCSKQSVIEPLKETTVAGRCSPSCSLGLTVDNSFDLSTAFTSNTLLKTAQTIVKNNTNLPKTITSATVNLSVIGLSIDSVKNMYIAVNGVRVSNIIATPVIGSNSLNITTSAIPAYGTKVLQVFANYGKVGGSLNVTVSVNGGCNSASSVLLTKWSED